MHQRDLLQIQTLDQLLVYCGLDFLLNFERYRPRRPHDGGNDPGSAFVVLPLWPNQTRKPPRLQRHIPLLP